MAKLGCLCGATLSNSLFPNEVEGDLTSSYGYKSRDVWECLECGRLAIDVLDDKGLTKVKWYNPDDGKVGNLFEVGTGEDLIKYLEDFWRWHQDDLKKLGIMVDYEKIYGEAMQEYVKEIHVLKETIRIMNEKD